jgi:FkbM family methyltransferase
MPHARSYRLDFCRAIVETAAGMEWTMRDGTPITTQQTAATTAAMRRKMEIEVALWAAPGEIDLRAVYFDHLQLLAAEHVGLGHAMLPELGHPLYFRGATPDVANMAQVFRDHVLDVPMAATPRHILVLGAYAGYAAVWLARRHPLAEIACVEPMPANLRLLTLNTGPWPRIRVLGTAAWHSATRLAVGTRLAGDWAPSLHDRAEENDRLVPARPVPDLLGALGWSRVDFVLCDIVGAEAAVFADPQASWLRQVDVALVQTHPGLVPGVDQTVAACFPSAFYDHRKSGECALFQRRVPLRAYPPAPPRLKLIADEPRLVPLSLHDLEPVPWAFFIFDGRSCQLHPNMPGHTPARAVFPHLLSGQTRFSATLHHAGAPSAPIVFAMVLERPDGSEVLRAERVVAVREQVAWSVPLPAPTGPHRVVLQTTMAPEASNNNNAWARWLDPTLS